VEINEDTYAKITYPILRKLLKRPIIAVGLHWAFQSLFYMDSTERWFKLSLDLIFTLVLALTFSARVKGTLACLWGFLLAHTLNFLFNGQIWGVLKTYGYIAQPYTEFFQYVTQLSTRAAREPSIKRLIVYGSLARQDWSPTSDLDGRILRKPGFRNGVRSCWFLMKERSRALVSRFPLDLYVIDDISSLTRLRADEEGIELKDGPNPFISFEIMDDSFIRRCSPPKAFTMRTPREQALTKVRSFL
jgi:predicted nucleotidyltransferase